VAQYATRSEFFWFMNELNSRSDHDILITLFQKVSTNHDYITEKMENFSKEIAGLRDATNNALASLELRVGNLEKLVTSEMMRKLQDDIDKNSQWIMEYKITWRNILAIAGVIGAIIGLLSEVALKAIFH
jgi:hypothetical protein